MTVAETMTQRERLRRDVDALTAEGRMIAPSCSGCCPSASALVMYVINPDVHRRAVQRPARQRSCSSAPCVLDARRLLLDEEDHQDRDLTMDLTACCSHRPRSSSPAPSALGLLHGPQPGRREGRRPRLAAPARRLRGRERPRPGAARPAHRAGRACRSSTASPASAAVHPGRLRRQRPPEVRLRRATARRRGRPLPRHPGASRVARHPGLVPRASSSDLLGSTGMTAARRRSASCWSRPRPRPRRHPQPPGARSASTSIRSQAARRPRPAHHQRRGRPRLRAGPRPHHRRRARAAVRRVRPDARRGPGRLPAGPTPCGPWSSAPTCPRSARSCSPSSRPTPSACRSAGCCGPRPTRCASSAASWPRRRPRRPR